MQDVEEFLNKGGFKEFKLRRLKSQEILFIFKRKEDYLRWFHRRKWNIKSSTITLCKWSVDYSPFKDCPVIPVWVEIKNIPLHLSDQIPLYSIASALGKPLKLGRKTAMGIYPGSAKVCVEMDVSISKPPKIHLRHGTRDLWLPCSYEDHPPFCSKCLRFGHQLFHCRKLSSHAELLGPSGAGGSKQVWKMVMRKVPKPSDDLRLKAPTPGKHLQNPVLFNPPQIPQSKSSSGTEQPTTSLDMEVLLLHRKPPSLLLRWTSHFAPKSQCLYKGLNILLAMPQGAKQERMYLPTPLHEASVLECLLEELSFQTETEYEANPTQENRERMQKANAELILATKLEVQYWKQKANIRWGDNRNLLKLKVTLDIYLKATGQEINLNKSRFYTSKHTTSSQNQHMEKALGIKRGNLPFTYLGAPICKGILRKERCKDILGHFEKLIHSW
ncbi:unnamed protein product [Cuscuta campestris]|uniref:Uncharacterized protein n=1 Tax=Cuscuta campestris TaxID=132261 RepID=A0A484M2R6_9ASTE|nr:unnamed protein product [Cuscuta campestris]